MSLGQIALCDSLPQINVYADANKFSNQIDLQENVIKGVSTWEQALSQLPGAYVYSEGGILKLNFNGGFNKHILMIVDDVPVADSTSIDKAFDFNLLDLSQVKSIKVLKKHQSLKYGHQGVVVLIETTNKNKWKIESGSYGTIDASLDYLINESLGSTLRYHKTDGISSAAGGEESDGQEKLFFSLGQKKESFSYGLKFTNQNLEIDRGAGSLNDDPNYKIKQNQIFLYANAKGKKSQLNTVAKYNHRKSTNSPDSLSSDIDDSTLKGHDVFVNYSYQDKGWLLASNLSAETIDVDAFSFGVASQINSKNKQSSYLAASKSIESQNLGFDIGFWGDYDSIVKDNFGYSTALNFKYGRLIIEQGFFKKINKPTLYQIYDPQFGNKDLKEEEVSSYIVNLEYLSKLAIIKLSYEIKRLENLIDFDPATSKSINIDKAKIEVISIELNQQVRDYNLAFNSSYFINFEDGEDVKLRRRPRWTSALSISKDFIHNISVSLIANYIGPRKDLDIATFSVIERLPSYKKLDLFISKKQGLSNYFIRLENLSNDKTMSINGYSRAGFTAFAGLEKSF